MTDFLLTIVPFTCVVTCVFSGSPTILERPKSATLAVRFSSSNILFDLMSLCIIGGSASS